MPADPWLLAGMIVVGYLVGSIPFGVLAAKSLGAADPRTAGSGNIGFSNVLRQSGKAAGALTLVGDMGKGWVVAWSGTVLLEDELAVLAVGLSVVFGHIFSVFLGFRGGKGVATGFGAVLGIAPWLGLAVLAVWLVTVGAFRYSSGGAIAAFGLLPLIAAGIGRGVGFVAFSVAISVVILFRHRENIVRLWNGTEQRMEV